MEIGIEVRVRVVSFNSTNSTRKKSNSFVTTDFHLYNLDLRFNYMHIVFWSLTPEVHLKVPFLKFTVRVTTSFGTESTGVWVLEERRVTRGTRGSREKFHDGLSYKL